MADNTIRNIRHSLEAGVMTYSEHDVRNRLINLYEAAWDAQHGDGCLLTKFKYVGDTSVVEKSIELAASWDSAWHFDA